MRRYQTIKLSVLFVVAMCFNALGQLSPGDLAEPHAGLEGLLNCTKCHTLGKGITNEKCLSCHEILDSRIKEGLGYHTSVEVKGKTCVECHSDHHGRTFDIIRFDEQAFQHDLTGYNLEGAHAKIDCRDCHKPELIKRQEIKAKDYTFLGLDAVCISCHTDTHQGTLSSICSDCHGYDAFKPATEFSHDHTNFPLKGKHKEITCIECHMVETVDGESFQHFAGVPYTNCTDCHDDIHNGRFGQNCKECHTEQSFHVFIGMNNFDHNKTQFPLIGKHRKVDCASCHQDGTSNRAPFQEFVHTEINSCAYCHDDVHENKFGRDCKQCHSEQSFRYSNEMAAFDHQKTDFVLEGLHTDVDCKSCHTTSMVEPLAHNTCVSCHEDYHENVFIDDRGVVEDCKSCHTVHGFAGSTFTIENHALTDFPLNGAHLATPCLACHKKEEQWHFRDLGLTCVECHEDIHRDLLAEHFYPNQDCRECHTEQRWNDVAFDHYQTDFALEGGHLNTDCIQCHKPGPVSNSPIFQGLDQACTHCHDNIHRTQFEVEGHTDCMRCHGFEDWTASKFDHNQTQFILEGAHTELSCAACHYPEENTEITYIKYKIDDIRCVACHQ